MRSNRELVAVKQDACQLRAGSVYSILSGPNQFPHHSKIWRLLGGGRKTPRSNEFQELQFPVGYQKKLYCTVYSITIEYVWPELVSVACYGFNPESSTLSLYSDKLGSLLLGQIRMMRYVV
jgi:hypothetical protein